MTPEQQRIAIANACGEINPRTTEFGGCVATAFVTKEGVHVGFHGVPDYLNDLNAMHDVEIDYIIPNGLWDDYVTHLKNLMKDGKRFWGQATAGQRAEAFLRTLNLWKE
jgi:hypothetical protein